MSARLLSGSAPYPAASGRKKGYKKSTSFVTLNDGLTAQLLHKVEMLRH